MKILDKAQPYATVTGHPAAAFEQNGMLFDGAGLPLVPPPAPGAEAADDRKDDIIETDEVESAKQFLLNVLSSGPLSKSALYKVAEENNQPWDAVRKAYVMLRVVSYAYRGVTMWKLNETTQGAN